MEINHALLVAMMFVVVLTLGITNILMAFSEIADRRSSVTVHPMPFVWLLLLLGFHLELFWQSLDILAVENWSFGGFVVVLAGPIVLFLATNVLLPRAESETRDASREHYLRAARQFFLLMSLVAAWLLGTELIFGGGMSVTAAWNTVYGAVLVTLAMVPRPGFHAVATVFMGVTLPIYWLFQGFGAIS